MPWYMCSKKHFASDKNEMKIADLIDVDWVHLQVLR